MAATPANAPTPPQPPAQPDPQFPGKTTQINDPKSEAPEVRDADEIREEAIRIPSVVPIGSNGRPMAKLTASVSDKIPTVQYGNVVITAGIERWVDDTGEQDLLDASRIVQRDVQYVVGRERTLLTWALDPSKKVQNPHIGEDHFAAKPAGYDDQKAPDPREMPVGPATTAPAAAMDAANQTAASPPAPGGGPAAPAVPPQA